MLRVAILTLLAVAAFAGEARAALPPANPPNTEKLAREGVHVTWPLTKSVTLYPVHRLAVPVRSRRPVTVSLVAVDGRGRGVRTLERRTLRNGVFETGLPSRLGARFALRLEVAGKRYWSWIKLGANPEVTCEHGTSPLPPRFSIAGEAFRSGGRFEIVADNQGRCPVAVFDDLGVLWERPGAAGWEPVPLNCGTNTVLAPGEVSWTVCDYFYYTIVPAKGEWVFERGVPHGLTPGRYRVSIGAGIAREVDVHDQM